jgi:hypothetical protein
MQSPQSKRYPFKLRPCNGGYVVIRRGTVLGKIRSTTERSGRVAFLLSVDRRRKPRTYRGRHLAAQAVAAMYELARRARRGRMTIEQIVLAAWSVRPPSSLKAVKPVPR